MSVLTLNIIVLRKNRLIFEICHNFYLISLNLAHTRKPFPGGYKLKFIVRDGPMFS